MQDNISMRHVDDLFKTEEDIVRVAGMNRPVTTLADGCLGEDFHPIRGNVIILVREARRVKTIHLFGARKPSTVCGPRCLDPAARDSGITSINPETGARKSRNCGWGQVKIVPP